MTFDAIEVNDLYFALLAWQLQIEAEINECKPIEKMNPLEREMYLSLQKDGQSARKLINRIVLEDGRT